MAFDSAGISDAVAKVSVLVVGTTLYFYISSGNCCQALLIAYSTQRVMVSLHQPCFLVLKLQRVLMK